jgi:hypothetical protein
LDKEGYLDNLGDVDYDFALSNPKSIDCNVIILILISSFIPCQNFIIAIENSV